MVRCGIVLAGGEGKRLQPFIHRLRGDALPKQYVNFLSGRSMLQQTIGRAEMLIPPERVLTVVGRQHLEFREAVGQLATRPLGTVIVQPENKDTGPGLLLPLIHLAARHSDPVVAVFPSDHFIVQEALFMDHVEQACRAVERNPNQLVLLGVEPQGPDPEYGYILPGRGATDNVTALKAVAGFVEKPHPADAERLLFDGAFWNTFVMVGRTLALLDLVRRLARGLYDHFLKIRQAIGTRREQGVTEEAYRTLAPVNFSKALLERIEPNDPLRLAVMPVHGVFWSDWGSEQRLVAGLEKTGYVYGDDHRPLSKPLEAEGV